MTKVDAKVAAQAEMASRVLSKRRLLPFIQRMNDQYQAGWVHEDVCRRLEKFSEDVANKKSPRLMLLMPPRSGKSEIASRCFPAWHLGRFPDHEFIACSYNMDLATDFSRKVKQILEDPSYKGIFPDTKLDPDNRSAEKWVVHGKRGGYVAAGVGGGITGRGAHILVVDDPIKSAEDADSGDNREKLWQWYLSTAYSRLAPGGGVLLVNTWWHDDDLSGRLQTLMRTGSEDQHIDQFIVVKYPAIAEADEYLNHVTDLIEYDAPPTDPHTFLRAKGEALHPARYDLDKLLRIKAQNKGGRWWSALYQQNPVPDDGGYFEKSQFRRALAPSHKRCNVFIAWDFAISEKKHNDYTVGTVGLQDDNDILHIVDQIRFKSGDAFFIVDSILTLAAKWYSPSLQLGFEDGQIYRSLEALLKKRMRERRVYPSITVLKPLTDKLTRARALQGRMQQGMVSFTTEGEWYDSCRQEMLRFPAGAHDDQCLVAGTLIAMADGTARPIEYVVAGDMVLTPLGSCMVAAAGMTSLASDVVELMFSNGATLTGTCDHPVALSDGAFAPLGSIALRSAIDYNERLSTSWSLSCLESTKRPSRVSALSSMGGSIAATRSLLASTCATISRALGASITRTFGLSTTVLCLTGMTFTTGTTTRSTTSSATLSACLAQPTSLNIPSTATARSRPLISGASVTSQRLGTRLQKGWLGMQRMAARLGLSVRYTNWFAGSVERSSPPLSQVPSSARNLVSTSTGSPVTLTMTSRRELGKRPVFNLTVQGEHVYYANGFLVHNCDSLAYVALMAVGREPPAKPREQKVASWADKLYSPSSSSFMAA